jgi:crotonobetainyl-CoA:carnitine CoA-transferase CaiB-like acyl-CoA transferase
MSEQETLLGDIRVLDLADQKGVYCTKLLADLGADVIKIEKPGGDPMRRIGPFFHDEPDPEKSLYWFQFNTSKRGITLDLDNADGREIFNRLVKTADVVVETFPPGYLDEMGLGYSVLKELNPRLILSSITPFGQTGPYLDFKSSDLIAQAMGGLMYLAGFPEDPPHKLHGSQAYHSASVQAAVGTVMALYARELTGRGQQVDVSMQESMLMSLETAMQHYDLRKEIRQRVSREMPVAAGIGLYPCKDGHIWSYVVAGAGAGWDVILDWMDSEGMAGDLKDPQWAEVFELLGDIRRLIAMANDPPALIARLEQFAHINEIVLPFLMKHTKREIFEAAAPRRIMMVPAQSPKDLIECPQLEALGYFVDVDHPELGTNLKYPGAPCYHISDAPWRIARRAPLIGEHNFEVYEKELGFSKEQLAILKQEGAI